ncbi:MAG: alanine racemase [Rhodobacteraceae bacterium]|nr:alanine racemase [Paracoccaceae bacterium]
MTAPRIEVDLVKIRQNARQLVDRLAQHGIAVTGVTKGVCGHPEIAQAMLDGGVQRLADARISNVERMRAAGIDAPVVLIRTPMRSQTDRVVRACGTSLNTDADVVRALAQSAVRAGVVHQVVLMVEMGDGREGVQPDELAGLARHVMGLDGVVLAGIGANFACLSGGAPHPSEMGKLSAFAAALEGDFGITLRTISGGNSASLPGLYRTGLRTRVNDLRLGEAILLGRDPVTRAPINGLSTDAFVLVAEIIESAADLPQPSVLRLPVPGAGESKSLLALGDQDTDISGLSMPVGMTRLGSSSDHLLLQTRGVALVAGSEVCFQPDYSALMRAMSAPDVEKVILDGAGADRPVRKPDRRPTLAQA